MPVSIVAGAAATVVGLSTGSAFAHECYFTNPNPHADARRAGTSAFLSFHDLAYVTWAGATRPSTSWPRLPGSARTR